MSRDRVQHALDTIYGKVFNQGQAPGDVLGRPSENGRASGHRPPVSDSENAERSKTVQSSTQISAKAVVAVSITDDRAARRATLDTLS
jgi:hypothetical protein